MFLADALSPRQLRSNLENPSVPLIEAFTGGMSTYTGRFVSEQTLTQLSVVFGILKIYSESSRQLPLNLYRIAADGSRTLSNDDPRSRLLNFAVNPFMNADVFRGLILSHVLGWGNFYAEIEFNQAMIPTALWPLPPSRVQRKLDLARMSDLYEFYADDGQTITIPAERMLHVIGPSFDGYHGVSPLRHFKQTGALGLALEEYTARFAGNDMQPTGVLLAPGAMSSEKRTSLLEGWREGFSGMENKHKIAVLSGGVEYKQITIDPASSQLLETRKFTNEEFCRLYRCPPHMLAILDQASFNNVEILDIGFVKHSLRPLLKAIECALIVSLFTPGDWMRWRFEHDVSDLLQGDPEKQAKVDELHVRIGAKNSNEIRRRLGLNPRADGLGDRYMQSVQFMVAGADEPEEDPDAEPEPEADDGADERSVQAARSRLRIQKSTALRGLVEAAISRVVAMEEREVRAATKKNRDLGQALRGRTADMTRQMAPALEATREQLVEAIRAELGIDDETPTPETKSGGLRSATWWANRHVAETLRVLEESDSIEDQLEEFRSSRAAAEAASEHRRFCSAVAADLFAAFGVRKLRWVVVGRCKSCGDRENQTVQVGQRFAGAKKHPPFDQDCDCMLFPA